MKLKLTVPNFSSDEIEMNRYVTSMEDKLNMYSVFNSCILLYCMYILISMLGGSLVTATWRALR